MSRRVLLVDDEPDVIEAVRQRLAGLDVRAVRTIDSAMEELNHNEYGLVLLDSCLADVESAQALAKAYRCDSYVLEANRRGDDRRPEPMLHTAGHGPIGLDSLKRAYGNRCCASDPCVRDVAVVVANAVAEEPSVGAAASLLREVRAASGADYAIFFAALGTGIEVLCEDGADGGRRIPPRLAVVGGAQGGLSCVESCGETWVRFESTSCCSLALLAGRSVESATAVLSALGRPLAAFLGRCLAETAVDSGAVFVAALESLVHDTRNWVTGLALSLSAARGRAPGGADPHSDAAIGAQAEAIADICREYSRMAAANAGGGFGPCARDTVKAFEQVLERLGVGVSQLDMDEQFSLDPMSNGLLARALVGMASELANMRATGVSIRCLTYGKTSRLEIKFSAGRKWMRDACLVRMRDACEVVNRVGATATVVVAGEAGEAVFELPRRDHITV